MQAGAQPSAIKGNQVIQYERTLKVTLQQIVQTLKQEKMRRQTVEGFWRRRPRLVKFYPNTTGSSFSTQSVNSKEVGVDVPGGTNSSCHTSLWKLTQTARVRLTCHVEADGEPMFLTVRTQTKALSFHFIKKPLMCSSLKFHHFRNVPDKQSDAT